MPSPLSKFQKPSKWPSKKQWAQLFKILNKKERIVFLVLLGTALISFFSLIITLYFNNTEIRPAVGGKFTEGVVGYPRFINPIFAASNDVDRDLVEIIFSGLMKYGPGGEIIPDLAKEVKIQDEGKTYEVYLKENVLWHDGEKLTSDDVIFTLKTIQNPDYKSPLRGNYLGIEVEKISDYLVRFKLKNPYSGFSERLTFKILPRHIWQDISPQNFLLTNRNLKPVGSGPYRFQELKQDGTGLLTSIKLVRFNKYFEAESGKPYLSEINFIFFESEEKLSEAAKTGKIDGFSLNSSEYYSLFGEKSGFKEYSLSIPRYFALFFNPDQSKFLTEKEIRQALNHATDKTELIEEILSGKAKAVDSPILPQVFGYQESGQTYSFDLAKAEELLQKAGLEKRDGKWIETVREAEIAEFTRDLRQNNQGKEVTALQTCLARDSEIYPEGKITGYFGPKTKEAVIKFQEKYSEDILDPWGFKSGTGIVSKTTRTKLNEVCLEPQKRTSLGFTLLTVEDPVLKKVAEQLKQQWESLGVDLEIKSYPISQLEKDFIKPRNYEMLLLGEALGIIPDPFPFWHSSQIKDPGLNLARYENSQIDKLLEAARTTLNSGTRTGKLQEFQDILINDAPSVFLYSPDYLYWVSPDITGITETIISDPSQRFSNIEEWYTKTKRSWK